MPLRRRLLALVALVLALCLFVGGALTYWAGLRKIELEMSSAIEVGDSAVTDALSTIGASSDASAQLHRIVSSFDGDRHVVARLAAPGGTAVDISRLKAPVDPAPSWLYDLLAGRGHSRSFTLPDNLKHLGSITIEADPHNEVGEVWEDLKLKFLIVSIFCGVVLALIYAILGWALRPLEALSLALTRVGQGDYTAHVAETGPDDLRLIYQTFNRMAEQLTAAEQQNQRLNEQLSTVQEEERAEIARDLHDEIGPFLFAVDVDAQSIPLLLSRDADDDAVGRSKAIRQSVQHMQLHLRSILSRLRPAMLIDQGLTHAVEQLVAFWRARRPSITFATDIEDDRFPASVEETAFRILQEGMSNAVRHGKPTNIGLTARRTEQGELRVVVSDNGSGLAATAARGFGLVGLRERVAALGGRLSVAGRDTENGVMLIAEIPLPVTGHKQAAQDSLSTSAA
jgi:two-component system, NarL family, sensor histidine kinase UhpB